MAFLHPLFLLGLGFLSLPILLHLFQRKKAPLQPFPALEFVIRSLRRTSRNLKIKNALLLLTRCILLALLAFTFSKPLLGPDDHQEKSGPTSLAILVDTSMSMRFRPGGSHGKSLFQTAKESAGDIVNALGEGESAALFACGPSPLLIHSMTENKSDLTKALSSMEPGYGASDLVQCVNRGGESLEGADGQRTIFLLTDLRMRGWEGIFDRARADRPSETADRDGPSTDRVKEGSRLLHPGTKAFLHDVSGGQDEDNIALLTASVVGEEGAFNVEAEVKNFSSRPREVLCRLFIEDVEKGRTFVKLEPWGKGVAAFSFSWEAKGDFNGRIEISSDNLKDDDIRYFSFSSAGRVRTLVVDGEPHINPYESESFYVERALNPVVTKASRFHPEVVSQGSIPPLESYDIVFFLNIRPLSDIRVREVEDFVRRGGGVLFSLGENASDVESYNKSFKSLLPLPLRGVKDHPEPLRLDPTSLSFRLSVPFSPEEIRNVSRVAFRSSMLLEPSLPGNGEILMKFTDGSPALIAREVGKGRVFLFVSTLSRRWTDFPIRPVFLPLVQGISTLLAGVREGQGREILSGMPVDLDGESVRTPSGDIVTFGAGKINFRETALPGVYTIDPGPGYFVVNVDTSESDLKRISPDELRQALGQDRVVLGTPAVGKFGNDTLQGVFSAVQRRQIPLWGPLFFVIVLFFPVEAFLSR